MSENETAIPLFPQHFFLKWRRYTVSLCSSHSMLQILGLPHTSFSEWPWAIIRISCPVPVSSTLHSGDLASSFLYCHSEGHSLFLASFGTGRRSSTDSSLLTVTGPWWMDTPLCYEQKPVAESQQGKSMSGYESGLWNLEMRETDKLMARRWKESVGSLVVKSESSWFLWNFSPSTDSCQSSILSSFR